MEENKKPEVEEIPDGIDEVASSDYSDELLDWITVEEIESFTCTLYRIQGKRYSQIFKYRDVIPDSHEIGLEYGSGYYMLIGKFFKGKLKPKIKSYRLSLDRNYDDLCTERKRLNKQVAVASVAVQPGGDYGQLVPMFTMFKELFTLIVPLLSNQRDNSFNPEVMTGIYSNVNKLLYKNSLEQSKMITDLTKKFIEGNEGLETDDNNGHEPAESPVDKIIDMVKQFLPMFLTASGMQKSVMGNQVKNNPVFRQIVDNPDLLKQLVSSLNVEIGEEKTSKLLNDLGLRKKKVVAGEKK